MNPISYQIHSFNDNYNKLKNFGVGGVHKAPLFIDFAWCMVKYGASASDYFEYEFYNKKAHLKNTYCCYKLKRRFFTLFNDKTKGQLFNNKVQFLKTFSEYVHRDWLNIEEATRDQFVEFITKHPAFIAKPIDSSCGKGVQKVDMQNEAVDHIFRQLITDKMLIEECIIQHHSMSELNASSLNTVRLATVKIHDEFKVLGAFVRCGLEGMIVDNAGAGGLLLGLDPETGIVITDGCDEFHNRYFKHPNNGKIFHGFQIPHWDKVIAICRRAMDEVPGVNYIGWDIAIKENDVELVEGNFEGQMVGFQIPYSHGNRLLIEQMINETQSR